MDGSAEKDEALYPYVLLTSSCGSSLQAEAGRQGQSVFVVGGDSPSPICGVLPPCGDERRQETPPTVCILLRLIAVKPGGPRRGRRKPAATGRRGGMARIRLGNRPDHQRVAAHLHDADRLPHLDRHALADGIERSAVDGNHAA